jgi:hypothetical protein
MLVALDDMKTYLGIDLLDLTYDTFLTQQITLVSDTIEAYCQRKFELLDYVQTMYEEDFKEKGRAVKDVTLYHFPTTAITSIVEKDLITDTGTAITEYRVHNPTAKLISNPGPNYFFSVGKILEVEYTAGYASIPTPITQVVYNVVQENYNKKINGIDLNFGSDVQSIAIPGVINIQYDFSLQNNDRKTPFGTILGNNLNILDSYRSERAVIGSIRLAYTEVV